ncbi:MAG: hypothetical protein Q4G58_17760 [bacterium]|nr:hypothetical protein [bacterium]
MKLKKTSVSSKQLRTNDKPFLSDTHKWECDNCGALNNDGARYCASCGKSK